MEDNAIRRLQPKTLFKRKSVKCSDPHHKKCHKYEGWASFHPQEAIQLKEEARSKNQSVYVPHNNKSITIAGKTIPITGGIKSLDSTPPCLGTAAPVGRHPHSCPNCHKQKPYLQNLMSKREKASYGHLAGNRYGLVGFRHEYMKRSEQSDALSKEISRRTHAEKEQACMRKVMLTAQTWEHVLHDSCVEHDDQKLVTDLLILFRENVAQRHPLQVTVLKNLVGKLKSGNNHRFLDIIKDVSGLFKNRLGRSNYSLLEDAFGLAGSTTATKHIKSFGYLQPGMNWDVVDQAIRVYEDGPVCECSDEARTLRYLEPRQGSVGKLELVGHAWSPDVKEWSNQTLAVPRRDPGFGDPDDFSALNRLIKNLTSSERLAKGTDIHNFSALASSGKRHLVHCVWPVPSKGYTAAHLMAYWRELIHMARYDRNGVVRSRPLRLTGVSSDSAGHQLSAAVALMTPTRRKAEAGIPYLALGVPGEHFMAPYFWEYPTIAYLDYLHERRLFLKNMKYTTQDLTMWADRNDSTLVTVEHLKELRHACSANAINCGIKESDLLLIHFMDQNQDACNAVFTLETADLLDKHVPGSQGTSLYIRSIYHLTEPFHDPNFGDPSTVQESVSTGITVLRLWRNAVEIQKGLKLHSKPGAAMDPKKRGNFLTYGCYLTAEVQYSAASLHNLMMHLHFRELGPRWCSPHLSGTKATERIIAELQGKTTEIQCLDAQPTYGDIIQRISNVQFNQAAVKSICLAGGKVTPSSSHKKTIWQFSSDDNQGTKEASFPPTYDEFIKQQRQAHFRGVRKAQDLCQKYLPRALIDILKKKNVWDQPSKSNIPDGLTIIGSLNDLPCDHDELDKMLTSDTTSVADEVMDGVNQAAECNQEEEANKDSKSTSICGQMLSNDDYGVETKEGKEQWYITRVDGSGSLSKIHIKRAISILLPREYVSRERSRRHWASKYISGLKPPEQHHDIFQFRDVAYSTGKSSNVKVGWVLMIQSKSNGAALLSASSSSNDAMFRCRPYVNIKPNKYQYPGKAMVSTWIPSRNFLCEIHLEKSDGDVLQASDDSCTRLNQLRSAANDVATEKDLDAVQLEPDMYEVEDIINRRLNSNTQTFEYKVRFKGFTDKDDVWLPSAAFNQTIKFESHSRYGRKRKHQTSQKEETDPFASHFLHDTPCPKKSRHNQVSTKKSGGASKSQKTKRKSHGGNSVPCNY